MKSAHRLFHLLKPLRYSLQGISAIWRHEAAFQLECILYILLFPCSFLVTRTLLEWLVLIAITTLVLIIELLNSAIESVVDRIGSDYHELSGRAKDAGSAAVFICLLLAGCAWGTFLVRTI